MTLLEQEKRSFKEKFGKFKKMSEDFGWIGKVGFWFIFTSPVLTLSTCSLFALFVGYVFLSEKGRAKWLVYETAFLESQR